MGRRVRQLIAPDTIGSWSFGIEGLYAQSTAPQYQYVQVDSNTEPDKLSNQLVASSYQIGFEADGTYHFAGNNRDVSLLYTHLKMNNTNTSSILGDETFVDPYDLLPARHDEVDQIQGATNNLYNSADLVFGQHLSVGHALDIHPFGGIRYVDLDSRDNSTYYNAVPDPNPIQATAQIISHFQGLGPRIGVDATFQVNSAISLTGTIGSALEVGYDDPAIALQVNGDLPTNTTWGRNWYIVPELDAKLGVDYNHSINPTTSFDVQLGYLVTNYFNAVEEDYDDVAEVNSQINRQDFGFQGPYLRVQLNVV